MKKLLLLSAILIGAATASQAGVRLHLGLPLPPLPPLPGIGIHAALPGVSIHTGPVYGSSAVLLGASGTLPSSRDVCSGPGVCASA